MQGHGAGGGGGGHGAAGSGRLLAWEWVWPDQIGSNLDVTGQHGRSWIHIPACTIARRFPKLPMFAC